MPWQTERVNAVSWHTMKVTQYRTNSMYSSTYIGGGG